MLVRRAREADLPFIARLTLETCDQSIPEGRDVTNEAVRTRAGRQLDAELSSMLRRSRDVAVLVATHGERSVGFLILELNLVEETTGERQTHIFNMAVEPEYLGRRVDRLLVSEAARITHRRGCRYMTGRITAGNQRALMAALKQGFEIERCQVVMACGPEGPVPLPGRPAAERAHATSRLLRRMQRGTLAPD